MKEKRIGISFSILNFQFSIPKVILAMTVVFYSALSTQHSALLFAQHTNHEIGFSFAYGGQSPFVTSGNNDAGFFRQPFIWNFRYQVATNYVQSLSFILEHVGEERSRTGL